MRWQVDVTSIGKTDTQSFVVDAESWQKALQNTRSMRGETGPMSGFSIELLEAGFRAVDPMARLIYVVKRAADDAQITAAPPMPSGAPKATSVAPPARASARPPAPASASVPAATAAAPSIAPAAAPSVAPAAIPAAIPAPAPTPPRPGGSVAPPGASKKKQQATMVFGSTGDAVAQPPQTVQASPGSIAPAPAPAAAAVAAPEPSSPPSAPNTDRELPSEGSDSAVVAAAQPIEDAPTHADNGSAAAGTAIQVIFKREQDPNATSPLTYREYVFAVATGTSDEEAGRMLTVQFDLVKHAIESHKQGKLVNLAVFDVVFQGKPPVPPLATLVWKDWKGAPVVEFPRRNPGPPRTSNRPSANAQSMPAAAIEIPKTAAPPAALFAPPVDGVSVIPVTVPAPVIVSAPPPAAAAATIPVAAAATAAVTVPASAVTAPPVAFPPPAATPRGQHFTPAPAAHSVQAQRFTPMPMPTALIQERAARGQTPRPGAVRGRASGDELITALFEAMHDLHFLRDAIEGAEFCLALAMETLPSRAGVVHLYDIDKREFVVASASGTGTEKLILKRHPESEPMLASAMRKRRAIVYADASKEAEAATERFQVLGGAKSLIIAPVMQAGRFLGVIEMVNPLDGAPFTEQEGAAINYIAEQYAEFVAARGVVTDAERISLRSPPIAR